jgi:hypothetical protein
MINIKLPLKSITDSVLAILAVCLIVSGTVLPLSMFATTCLSAQDKPEVYKIDNIRYIENFNQFPDSGENHRLLKSELSKQTKQRIMNQKNVTVADNGQLDISEETAALTTDTGAYVINVENQHNTRTEVKILFVTALLMMLLPLFASYVNSKRSSSGGDDSFTLFIAFSGISLVMISMLSLLISLAVFL